jgi:apolipoprotein D and lipocalin family protein
MNKKTLFVIIIAFATLVAVIAVLAVRAGSLRENPLPTAPFFELDRFTGTWYVTHEIPVRYTTDCSCSQATYWLSSDDSLQITNACVKPDGIVSVAKGVGVLANPNDPTRLKIRFEGTPSQLFPADYYVLDVAHDYRVALVGVPDRSSLWLLSRERVIAWDDYVSLVDYAGLLGFDVTKLVVVNQTGCSSLVVN